MRHFGLLGAGMGDSVIQEVVKKLEVMPRELQWRVLEFAHSLVESKPPRGVPGARLVRFAGSIPSSDVALMHEAIQKACEQVHVDEW